MADFNSKITIDAQQAVAQLEALDKALGSSTVAMGTFQGVADKSIGGSGFAEVTKSAEAFGKTGTAAMKNVANESKKTSQSVKAIGLSFRDVGRIVESQIIFAAISGIRQGLSEAADAAAEFQLQLSRIAAISDLDFGNARQEVEQLAIALGRDLDEVGEAVFEALQNDLGTTEETFRILREEAQQLALVTGGTLPQAVNALSSVYKTFGNDLGTTASASEQFFGTINAGRITLSDLESSLGTLSPLARQIGVSFKELTDSLATITLTGTKANVATTQLRNVFNKLLKPTKELQKVYEDLGVTGFEQLSKQSGGFVKALEALAKEVEGQEDGLARLFNTIRANVGVLNVLTNDTKLYDETVKRTTESAKNLSTEIANIDSTAAREAAKNAAELEVIFTQLGDKVLDFKVAAGDAFLAFISQSENAIAVQTSLAAAVGAATIAIVKFGVAASVAVPPLAAAVAVIGGFAIANEGLEKLVDGMTALAIQTQNLEVERLEALKNTLEEIRAEEIAEVNEQFEDTDNVLNRIAESARKTGDELRDAFNIESGRIQAVEAELLAAFGDARTRVLGQIKDAIKDIDDQILDGKDRIDDLQRDLSDFSFEIRLEKLTDAQKATERLKRSAEATRQAFQDAADVGLSEASADAARESAKNAVQEAKAALSAAKRAGNAVQIQQAQKGVQEAITSQLAVERRLVQLRENVSKKQLQEQQEAFERLSAEAKTQVEEVLNARKAIADATAEGASDAEINKLQQALVKETNEARKALVEAGQSEILKTFDLEEQFSGAVDAIQQGLDGTQLDWQNAINGLREQLAAATDLKASVQITAQIEGLAEGSGSDALSKAVNDAIAKGGLPGEQLQNAAGAVRDTFEEQQKLQDQIQDSAVTTQLESAKAQKAFNEATLGFKNLNTGAVEATKLTKPILDQLSKLGTLNEEQLKKLLENLRAALPAIAEQTTGFLGTFTEAQKTALTEGVTAAIAAVEEQISTLEARELFDPANLEAARQVLDRISTDNIQDLGFEVDSEGFIEVQESLEEIDRQAEEARKRVVLIGTDAAIQAATGLRGVATTTQGLVTAANNAKGAYQNLLDIAKEALRVAQEAANLNSQNSSNNFFGGPPQFRAAGGASRGQDTIPTMLSPEEFVVNSQASRNFLPELSAINAGNAPSMASGGDTNITIGDVNVNSSSDVPAQTARDIAISLKRELRRGTSRL